MARSKQYEVYLRRDPKGPYARAIYEFILKCPGPKLHERVAELEAFSKLADPLSKYYVVSISQDIGCSPDEKASLPNEERRKVNRFLSSKLKMGKDKLEKYIDQYFVEQSAVRYIG